MNRKLSPLSLLLILTGLNLFNYFDRFVLSSVLPSLQSELNLNDSDAGMDVIRQLVLRELQGWI